MSRKIAIMNFREALIKRRDALRKVLAGEPKLNELNGQQPPGNLIDGVMESDQNEIQSKITEVQSQELARVLEALERIKVRADQYGVCEGCGINIPMERLKALPYATCCIDCQREAERVSARAGTALSSSLG